MGNENGEAYGEAIVRGKKIKLNLPDEVCDVGELKKLVKRMAKIKE